MQVPVIYSSKSKRTRVERGLSERSIKKQLEVNGWEVWRSENLSITTRDDVFPNVRRKYEKLVMLFETVFPGMLEELRYLQAVHHGMPDFVCFRKNECLFVECKRSYETLKENQKRTIRRLQDLGFAVEVRVIADAKVKMRRAVLLEDGKRVVEVQQRLKKNYKVRKKVKKDV